MYQIVLTGPESTGKSTLAKALADRYNVSWVSEYARHYIDQLNRPYEKADLLEIAKGQLEKVQQHQASNQQLLFIDTFMLVLKVWSEYKYGDCDPWILEQLQQNKPDLYVLCDIDVPWQYDEQREHPHVRAKLFNIYKNELTQLSVPYVIASGNLTQRLDQVHHQLQALGGFES